MSKTKLRKKAKYRRKPIKFKREPQNKTDNQELSNIIKDKLTSKPQKITSVQDTTLSSGQKGMSIKFDICR